VTDTPFLEENVLTQVYKKCEGSCASIYVELGNTGYSIVSGFVLTEEGYIATNQHVVDGGTKVTVIFYDGEEYDAKIVGEDPIRDLAVLKIEAKGLTPLPIGNSDALSIGQTTIAIGTPYDLSLAGTMTMGIISGLDRKIPIENDSGVVTKTMHLIQTDTPINPGNSGGPLINMAGQVVGINSLKLIDEFEGIGFAIPINSAVEIFNQLIQYGEVVQDPEADFVIENPRLGVQVYELQAGLEAFRIRPKCDYPEGVLVASVEPNTAVYAAGLELYDIITEFDGKPVKNLNDLTNALAQYRAGDKVTMTVFSFSRNFSQGEYKTLEFVLDSAGAIG
jgi:serine protease Do